MLIHPPIRVSHTYRQSLDGTPGDVLPLLCPVREAEWVPGWDPRLVLSSSGFVERDCIFLTPDSAAGPDAEAIWTVLEFDREGGRVEMLKVTPGFLVVRLSIVLHPRDGGSHADVTYAYTALGPDGEAFVRSRTAEAYAEFMRGWEGALNAYLRTRREAPAR